MADRRLSAQDALWLTMDRSTNLMVIDVAVVMGGSVELGAMRSAFRALVQRHPVFGQRAQQRGRSWLWVDDPEFDVAHHVREVDLGPGCGMRDVEAHVALGRSLALDRSRPLWTADVIGGVLLDDGTTGTVVVARFHHAIADGVRLTQVLLEMLDPDRAGTVPTVARHGAVGSGSRWWANVVETPQAIVRATATGTRRLGSGVLAAVTEPLDATRSGLRVLGEAARRPDRLLELAEGFGLGDHRSINDVTAAVKLLASTSPTTVWSGRLGVDKAVAWSPPIPLDGLKQAARAEGVTLNDLLVAALAGAVADYLDGRGGQADDVVWMVPVNLTAFDADLPEDLGNYFALVLLDLPLGGATRGDRIRAVHHRMTRIKNSDEPLITYGLQQLISSAPRPVATALTDFFANKAVGVLTNVPGPTRQLAFEGAPVRQVIGFAPCSGDQRLTATIFTYAGTVTVGFASDAAQIPDPQTMVTLVMDELEHMTENGPA